MSSHNPNFLDHKEEPRPWTPTDVACYGVIALLAYSLSPPWVMLFFRIIHAPGILMHLLSIFYAPITLARQSIPFIDMIYTGYRDLLQPWLFES